MYSEQPSLSQPSPAPPPPPTHTPHTPPPPTPPHPTHPKKENNLKTNPLADNVIKHLATDLFKYSGCHFLPEFLYQTSTRPSLWLPSPLSCTQMEVHISRQQHQQWIALRLGSPAHDVQSHYPQSNDFAKAHAKAMKALVPQCWEINSCITNADKWAKGLLQWCNNPWADGISPAQVVYGHPIYDTLPVHKHAFALEWQCSITDTNEMSIFTTALSMCTIMAMEMGNIE